jgi:hypothetical protein
MLTRYYGWALAEKALDMVPLGDRAYRAVGHLCNARTKGVNSSYVSSFRLIRKARESVPDGARIMEIGTGWFHHDAMLLYLVGDFETYLFDIEDKADLRYIKNFGRTLMRDSALVSRKLGVSEATIHTRLERVLRHDSRARLYTMLNWVPVITRYVSHPFFPRQSIDFMLSNCVVNHIPPAILEPELVALREILRDDGAMYHLIGHDDHWAFHDRSANMFNFYRYSDQYYALLFESLEYHNRMVVAEWREVFDRCGLEAEEWYRHATDESWQAIRSLPGLDRRFAEHPIEDLATKYSYVLLRKAGQTRSSLDGIRSEMPVREAAPVGRNSVALTPDRPE